MKKNISIVIKDIDCLAWKLPSFIKRFVIKEYFHQGCVYVKETINGYKPVNMSSMIKWLDNIEVLTYSEKRSIELSLKFLKEKYPEYSEFIRLF